MPRRTHKPARAKHDRGHLRFHRDRKINSRLRRYIALYPEHYYSYYFGYSKPTYSKPGRHANEDWWLGCHKAGCGMCDPDVWNDPKHPKRTPAKRTWKAEIDAAY